ncbi:MAG: tRNA (mo5U34)-methyltransferase [Gemmatimonadales bacterium]|jgi:tRNA (mo5U34)-methyltransferase|nr:tRNA (mo5U34)-methyltransferase [Gemmatimonadales bacterium]
MSRSIEPPAAEHRRQSEEIAALGPWFHNLHLPDGTETAPQHFLGDFPGYKWKRLAPNLPASMEGWTALDIGCNAGYYSFELARRGAQVTGIDLDSHYLRQARWAAKQFGLDGLVEFREMQIYDLARDRKKFDLVLFMGVFYHLRYPLLALDIVARRTERMMVFQTLRMPGMEVYTETLDHDIEERGALRHPGWPTMAFIEHRFAGDPTNWWIPNHAGIESMLRSSGMQVRGHLGHEIYLCEPAATNAPGRAPYDFAAELRSATGRPTA